MNDPAAQSDLARFRAVIAQQIGLQFDDAKLDFLGHVLQRRLAQLQHSSAAYLWQLEEAASRGEISALAQELTIGETHFFRNNEQFRALAEVALPERMRAHPEAKTLRLLSAGCASGEEPYSIAICLSEDAPSQPARILATDISTRALAAAEQGIYAAEKLKEFPRDWLHRYFLRGEGRSQGRYRVKDGVRRMVEFRRLNLIEPWQFAKRFAVIFCRNVMIYFDRPSQARLVNRLAEYLEPGGYLLIGHAESLNAIQHPLSYLEPTVYRK